jgi:hypothetical protein
MAEKESPHFKWLTPILADEADIPTHLERLAKEIDESLHNLKVAELGPGAKGQLIIVNAGGVAAWQTASGDVENNNAGVFTIIAQKVTAAKIALATITAAQMAGESIGTAQMVNLTVTAAKLAEEAVTAIKLANLSVTTAKIAELAVTESKLAALAVGTAKLANEAITTAKIANAAVTDAKLASPTLGRNQVIWRGGGRLVGKGSAGDWVLSLVSGNWIKSTALVDSDAVDSFRLSAADVFVPNKTAKLMVRFSYFAPNAVAPGQELKCRLSDLGESGPHWSVAAYNETSEIALASGVGLQRSSLSAQIAVVNYGLGEGKTVTNQIITPSIHLPAELATENLTIWAEILLTYV